MSDLGKDDLSPVKRALLEVREARARMEARAKEPIAIVGAGLRFPGGANDPESLWELLRNGVDAVTEIPTERWDIERYFDADSQAPGKMNTRRGSFIKDVDQFDAAFFGISRREAESMDPQQRLLLEIAWEAIERAGQSPAALFNSKAGVFLGITNSDYARMMLNDPLGLDTYVATGNVLSVAAGRLAYVLGLHGPSMVIDTACSSSLVAVHLAVQSLRQGECNLALAGAANLILSPELTISFSKGHMMAPDGRCKTFDAAGDGYVRGEGCAVLVLKRLSDALADGNPIMAVIRGSAINHDGRSSGLTAPNGPSQVQVIRDALAATGIEPERISYIEAHGTGTSLGDPIEVQALIEALAQNRASDNKLMLGSIKTNLGHTEATAGIAGILKAVLALQHRMIPPHLHLKRLNPLLELGDAPVVIPTRITRWESTTGSRMTGVSAFGLSGTNAHVILEEAPKQPLQAEQTLSRPQILCLSAKQPEALRELATAYRDCFAALATESTLEANVEDICFTANAGRTHFSQRVAIVRPTAIEIHAALAALADGQVEQTHPRVITGEVQSAQASEVTFLYSGQGANYLGMGQKLFTTHPLFRGAMEECNEIARPYLDRPLLEGLYPELFPSARGETQSLSNMTFSQVALFSLQYALGKLWRTWGVEPTMVLGHSAGEYAAACMAGVFSLEDGMKLVAKRGELVESLADKGVMYTVFADHGLVEAVLAPYGGRVSIAAYNGPGATIIAGLAAHVELAVEALRVQHIKSRPLGVGQAAHSPTLDPLLPAFGACVDTVALANPRLGMVSCTTGNVVGMDEVTNSAYWQRHLRQPVQFQRAMETLQESNQRIFVEIGPNPMLLALGQRCLPQAVNAWLPCLREGREDWLQLTESLGGLYTNGVEIDWEGFYGGTPHRRLSLPTYPFQRQRYWAAPELDKAAQVARSSMASTREAVKTAAQTQAERGPLDLHVASFPDKWRALERLSTAYILRAFQEMGCFAQEGEAYTAEEFVARFAIKPTYAKLMRNWLERLAGEGLLGKREAAFVSPRPLSTPDLITDLESALQNARAVMVDSPAVQTYVERCGERLKAVLTGAISPLETLFPNGSQELAETLYQHWSVSRYYAQLSQAVLKSYVDAQPLGKTLRVLEVGAGTGATTSAMLPVLPADRTTYTFTDVSELFLGRATAKFAPYPFVRYGILDIEKTLESQGYALQSFDVVVATNVLHAATDLHQALEHVRALLTPDGLLLLTEGTTQLAWFDITTSLIEGWQRFEDDLRHDLPLLSAPEWIEALSQHGFEAPMAWPTAGSMAEALGQNVIVAFNAQGVRLEASAAPVITGQQARASASQPDTAKESAEALIGKLRDGLPAERQELLEAFIQNQVARVLRIAPSTPIRPQDRLMDLGLDSLMALELRAMLSLGLGLKDNTLSATLAFDFPTCEAIAAYLLREVLHLEAQPPADPGGKREKGESEQAQGTRTAREREIAELSDEEVQALLLEKLERGR